MRLILLTSAMLMVGCTSKPSFWVTEGFAKPANPSFHIFVNNNIEIANGDDVTDDLGAGAPEDVFKRYFVDQLPAEMAQRGAPVKGIVYDIPNPIPQTISLPNETSISCSSPDTTLDSSSLIVSLCNIKVSRESETIPGYYISGPNGMGGTYMPPSNRNFLLYSASYVITHPTSKAPVAGGSIHAESPFAFHMNKSDWDRATSNLSQQILRGIGISEPASGVFSK